MKCSFVKLHMAQNGHTHKNPSQIKCNLRLVDLPTRKMFLPKINTLQEEEGGDPKFPFFVGGGKYAPFKKITPICPIKVLKEGRTSWS